MPKVPSSKKTQGCLSKVKACVPYARGFHPPTNDEQVNAIGFHKKAMPVEYMDATGSFFQAIPNPTSIDDWLAQYVEEGQTYRQYLRENPWFSRRKQKFLTQKFVPAGDTICEKYPDGKIYLVKMGDFSTCDVLFDDLLDYVQRFLCIPVQVLEGVNIVRKGNDLMLIQDPAFHPSARPGARVKRTTLHSRHNSTTGHVQIQVDSVLPKMHFMIPHDALCLVGLTPFDLYGDDPDLFVAGMASGSRRVAIFSLLRYNPALDFSKEFWYKIKETKGMSSGDKHRLMLQRSCKLVVHELCHLLGLAHCIYYRCCMNGSGHLKEDFDQPMMLCPVDLHKLQALINFDICKRYSNLLEFYTKHKFTEETQWVDKRLQFIQGGKYPS